MGVHGWTSFLVDSEILPKLNKNPIDLFALGNAATATGSPIPHNSVLHVDGSGLVHQLFLVALARYQQGTSNDTLPDTFMPLTFLEKVTQEFITKLTQQGKYVLKVYWDGDLRPKYKAREAKRRQKKRAEEWSNLYDFIQTGRLLSGDERNYPLPRLAITQVKCTLKEFSIFCKGEADYDIAKCAMETDANGPLQVVVGNDSDFAFFRGISYLPFSTLAWNPSTHTLYGTCIRRSDVVKKLDLPNEAALVEVTLALGNDFVPAVLSLNEGKWIENKIAYLRSKSAGYRLSPNPKAIQRKDDEAAWTEAELEKAMGFCRRWYDLEKIDTDEWYTPESDDYLIQVIDEEVGDVMFIRPACDGVKPVLPFQVDNKSVKFRPIKDKSMLTPVARCLNEALVDRKKNSYDGESFLLQQNHVKLLSSLTISSKRMVLSGRPTWDDVTLTYWIETILSKAFDASMGIKMARIFKPSNTFDAGSYFALLQKSREKITSKSKSNNNKIDNGSEEKKAEEDTPKQQRLPIDDHEKVIIDTIRKHRVSIIQGETGCGKSSRLPIMLLNAPPPEPALKEVEMFVSQPRRIAAKALVERVRSIEPELGSKIALRMGHGVREYESKQTKAWFVTTGYLVRLLANNMERFNTVSHLIVDEVHERSVDTDLLCWLCRRLLAYNPHIRLVLMSATLAASLYQVYFEVQHPVIHVGAKRFPLKEYYLEDFLDTKSFKLPPRERKTVDALIANCKSTKCTAAPNNNVMEKLCSFVTYLATSLGQPGSSVLIFVPGMNEIVSITELVEQIYVPNVVFNCFPIHSDIPFEDQMDVFAPAGAGEIKIMIATNAAESSVTLPDCDHVICLGLCKQIVYNQLSHRQMLLPTWISRASATQRAGRTARVRPGTVYRMYTRETFEEHMLEFEPGEMRRIPLDSVILTLKQIVGSGESVSQILFECLEPPDLSTMERSFESLHRSHFLTQPDDEGIVTNLGNFVAALGIDLTLGSLIGLGIQFGCGSEAIQLAGVLSFPQAPWIISNPLIHEPSDYNDQVGKAYVSRCHFDANLFSEPLAVMNLLWEYAQAPNKGTFCRKYSLYEPRLRRMANTCENLQRRVADFLELPSSTLDVETPPVTMPHAKICVLRILQAWVFHDSVIQSSPREHTGGATEETFAIEVLKKSDSVENRHLEKLLHPGRHPFQLQQTKKTEQIGTFSLADRGFDFEAFHERLLSYATEKGHDVVWWENSDQRTLCIQRDASAKFANLSDNTNSALSTSLQSDIAMRMTTKTKGRSERPSGLWVISKTGMAKNKSGLKIWACYVFDDGIIKTKTWKNICFHLEERVKANSSKGIHLTVSHTEKRSSKGSFSLESFGNAVSMTDLQDLFASADVKITRNKSVESEQRIVFLQTENKPLSSSGDISGTSWTRSPVQSNVPEGARLLSVLASGRRKVHMVRMDSDVKKGNGKDNEFVDIHLNREKTSLAVRWKRGGNNVYLNENSVPATALPLRGANSMYCICANALEVKGGGIRVEGLTLLPQGRLFFMLCRLTFGLFNEANLVDGTLIDKSTTWVTQANLNETIDKTFVRDRVTKAVKFHEGAIAMGENLVCYPEKVIELLKVFDKVDGHEIVAWDSLHSNPFTKKNRKNSKIVRKATPEY